MEQQLSKTIKSGEPLDHLAAVTKTGLFLIKFRKSKKWDVDLNHHVNYPYNFIKEQFPTNRNRDHFEHNFDLCLRDEHFRPIAFIEINGDVGYLFEGGKTKKHYKIAKPTKHSKKQQQINDGINKAYVERYHPNAKYITLLKEEVNGDAKDPDRIKNSMQYLQRELIEWIK